MKFLVRALRAGAFLIAVALDTSCGPPPPPACPACPPVGCPEPVLVARDGELYVKNLPVDLPRTAFLFALDPVPLSEGTRPPIGLLIVVEPESLKVAWFCKAARDLDAHLAKDGVPVKSVKPDKLTRFRGCWGRFKPKSAPTGIAPSTNVTPDILRLSLDIGPSDGVMSGDVYEVLGAAELNLDSRAGEFPAIGHCTIIKEGLSNTESVCLLDTRSSPAFQEYHWSRGGHVHLQKRR